MKIEDIEEEEQKKEEQGMRIIDANWESSKKDKHMHKHTKQALTWSSATWRPIALLAPMEQ